VICWAAQDERVLMWAAERLKGKFDRAHCRWLAFFDGLALRAVVIYHDFTEAGCSISVATDGSARWALRSVWKRMFDYPFEELGKKRVTFVIHESNYRSAKLARGFGARLEGELRCAADDGATIELYGLLAKDRRF
jgi:hypothetical protein